MIKQISIAVISTALISGCNKEQPIIESEINQKKICEVSTISLSETTKTCSPGQKILFLPKSFGNAQYPVLFAAINCDHRYQIALTEGAVSCIFMPINPIEESSK